MPHMTDKPYAVVSCHVERPLDDDCWRRFSRLQERRPGGFAIAALMRPPDADAGEDAELWLDRAREAAERGPLGHHTHFVGPAHARPAAVAPSMRSASAARRCGCASTASSRGSSVAAAGTWTRTWLPCWPSSATRTARGRRSFRPISRRARRASPPRARRGSHSPTASGCSSCRPRTRSAWRRGRLRAALPPYVHVYFHDTDLLSARRRSALRWALAVLGRRCEVTDLDSAAKGLDRPPRAGLRPTLTPPWQASLRPRSSPPARRRSTATSGTSGAAGRSASPAPSCERSCSASAASPASSRSTSSA